MTSLHNGILRKMAGAKAEPYRFLAKEDLVDPQESAAPAAEKAEDPAPEETRAGGRTYEDVFDYASVQTEAILDDARRQAEQIKTNAYAAVQPELDTLRAAARNEGYRDGYAAGMAQAMETYRQEREQQAAALEREVKAFLEKASQEQLTVIEQTKNDMRDLSLAVAEKVIQVSLRSSSAVISKMIQRATERLKRREWVHVYIAGCNSREIAQMTPQLAAALSPLSDHIRVVPVNEEERGTCIIEMPDTIIDTSVSTQMENIRALVQEIPNEDQEGPMSFSRRISDIE